MKRWDADYNDRLLLNLLLFSGALIFISSMGFAFLMSRYGEIARQWLVYIRDEHWYLIGIAVGLFVAGGFFLVRRAARPSEGWVELDGDTLRLAYGRRRATFSLGNSQLETSRWVVAGTHCGTVLRVSEGRKRVDIGGYHAVTHDQSYYDAPTRQTVDLYLSDDDFWELANAIRPAPSPDSPTHVFLNRNVTVSAAPWIFGGMGVYMVGAWISWGVLYSMGGQEFVDQWQMAGALSAGVPALLMMIYGFYRVFTAGRRPPELLEFDGSQITWRKKPKGRVIDQCYLGEAEFHCAHRLHGELDFRQQTPAVHLQLGRKSLTIGTNDIAGRWRGESTRALSATHLVPAPVFIDLVQRLGLRDQFVAT